MEPADNLAQYTCRWRNSIRELVAGTKFPARRSRLVSMEHSVIVEWRTNSTTLYFINVHIISFLCLRLCLINVLK
jgi:hypothetical protein